METQPNPPFKRTQPYSLLSLSLAHARSLALSARTCAYSFPPLLHSYIPHILPPTEIAPREGLHLLPDGLLRSEGAWLFYVLAKLGLDYEAVNHNVRAHGKHFPPGCRIPPIHDKLKQGKAGGQPKNAMTLKMSGYQVMHFCLQRYEALSLFPYLSFPLIPISLFWCSLISCFCAFVLALCFSASPSCRRC